MFRQAKLAFNRVGHTNQRRRAPIQAVRRPAPSPVPPQQSASDAFLLAVLTFGVAGAGIAAAGQWVGAL